MHSTISGFPRIGDRRELKTATEGYWAGRVPAGELEATARELRRQTWTFLRDAGIGQVPSNHFSLYDQVLDTCVLVGAVPSRYGTQGGDVDLDTYFAMARGRDDATAMEMTKWFDTNYHYLVPELGPEVEFRLAARPKPLAELAEARELGIATRPVLLGPVTFLLLGKPSGTAGAGFDRLSLLDERERRELLAVVGAGGLPAVLGVRHEVGNLPLAWRDLGHLNVSRAGFDHGPASFSSGTTKPTSA